MGTLNSVNIYDVYLSGLNRFPLVILRPLPVPLPLPFPIVPFLDSGFTEVMKFQRLFKLLSCSFLHTRDHISKSWLKDVIKRKGVQVMELTFGIGLLPQLSSSYFFFWFHFLSVLWIHLKRKWYGLFLTEHLKSHKIWNSFR